MPYQRNCECNRIDKYSDIFIDGITQQSYSSLVDRFTPVDVRGRYGSHVAGKRERQKRCQLGIKKQQLKEQLKQIHKEHIIIKIY